MASVNAEDIQNEAKFMDELWQIMKRFWIPEERDEYWADLVRETNELTKKYPSKFCQGQCMAFITYLDDEWQRQRGEKQ